MVDSLGSETHFAGDHRVVGVAVSAVVATGGQDTVQQGSAGEQVNTNRYSVVLQYSRLI